jgi:DHA2 family lincomycin resistance protein-like MFS transporter
VTLSVSFGIGTIALGLFIWRQLVLQKSDRALLDLRVFRSLNFSLAIAQMGLLSLAFFGAITVVPLYMQSVLQVSALTTALVVLPGALAMGLAGPIIGRIYDRWGTRVLLIPGSVIASAILWFYTTVDESTSIWVIALAQTILSIGLALSFTPLFTASLGSLQPRFYSYGSAVLGTVQQVAGAAGIALMITIMASVTAGAVESGASEAAAGAQGVRAAFMIAAIVSLPLLVGAFLIRKPADQEFDAPIAH